MRLPRQLQNALDWLRFDVLAKRDPRTLAVAGGGLVALLLIGWVIVANPFSSGGGGQTREVTIAVATDNAQQAPVGVLGYPLVATRNTTRISGPDPIDDAAAAALATHPAAPEAPRLGAVTLVPDDGWQAGIAASVFAGPPLRFPVLVSQHGAVPDATTQALAQLNPQGGGPSGGVQAYSAGGASVPSGLKSQDVPGDSPAEIANSIDQLRQRLTKQEPQHILLVSSDQAGYAMPAAAWAARSGDPVLFTGRNQVPAATLAALRRHVAATVYVIGPESAISRDVVQQVGRVSATVQRVGATGAVQNALLFARYSDGPFGWNINDPGHGMELANAGRPLDAAAAASLASSGKWGPLLITDTADALPPELRSFLLDIKPGYDTDPTRAVFNHIWLMGDATAIGGQVQAEIDELAELTPIGAGGGGGGAAGNQGTANGGVAQPGGLEGEPNPTAPQSGKKK
ncbi:MAG TPA: cell wall-binding repeat-containing protein [Solirubrobacterales bacterium]|nr:cell wall-binding repeat-containing protein [Solirubrobacterales bacterium]